MSLVIVNSAIFVVKFGLCSCYICHGLFGYFFAVWVCHAFFVLKLNLFSHDAHKFAEISLSSIVNRYFVYCNKIIYTTSC